MNTPEQTAQSASRLRLGILFILVWWLPIWLLTPAVTTLLGDSGNQAARQHVLVVLVIIQTVFGLVGILLTSRSIVPLYKKLPRKKVPGAIWHILRTGKMPESLH